MQLFEQCRLTYLLYLQPFSIGVTCLEFAAIVIEKRHATTEKDIYVLGFRHEA